MSGGAIQKMPIMPGSWTMLRCNRRGQQVGAVGGEEQEGALGAHLLEPGQVAQRQLDQPTGGQGGGVQLSDRLAWARRRTGRDLRVMLRRPWWSSGDDERLAVVMAPPPGLDGLASGDPEEPVVDRHAERADAWLGRRAGSPILVGRAS